MRTSNLIYWFAFCNNCMFVSGNKIQCSIEQVSFQTSPKWAFSFRCFRKTIAKTTFNLSHIWTVERQSVVRRSFKKNEIGAYTVSRDWNLWTGKIAWVVVTNLFLRAQRMARQVTYNPIALTGTVVQVRQMKKAWLTPFRLSEAHMSVRPCVHITVVHLHWTDFHEISY
jgi:hypothetical protein